MSQSRVAVRDKVFYFLFTIFCKSFDYYTKICQTLIDTVGLLQSYPSCHSLRLSLRASQIYNVEFSLNSFIFGFAFVINCEDCMTPRGITVHGMCTYNSQLLTIFEVFLDLLIRLTTDWGDSLDKDNSACLLDFYLFWSWVDKISEFLVVYLKISDTHFCLVAVFLIFFHFIIEDILKTHLKQSFLFVLVAFH